MIFLQVIKNLKINIKFFYACSSHIFGNSSKYPQNELTQIKPNSIYGITKASGLFGCRKFRNQNIFASTGILYSHVSENRSVQIDGWLEGLDLHGALNVNFLDHRNYYFLKFQH